MAKFSGMMQEYHDFIGPRIRNVINTMTRKARMARSGICEHCGQKATLQSAHVHGRERRAIIENVLRAYREGEYVIINNLVEVEKNIIRAHEPIEETFKFLCAACHREYDNGLSRLPVVSPVIYNDDKKISSGDKVVIGGVEVLTKRKGNQTKQYLFDVLPKLLNVINEGEIDRLQSLEFCKQKLGMAYPVITKNSNMVIDATGRRRYYPQTILNQFYVCNDWYEKQFSKWALYLVDLSRRI